VVKNVVVKDKKKRSIFELDQYKEGDWIVEEKNGKGLKSKSYFEKFAHVEKSVKQMTRVIESIDLGYDEAEVGRTLLKISAKKYVLAYATDDWGVFKAAVGQLANKKNTVDSDITWGVLMGHPTGNTIDESKVTWVHHAD